MNTPEPPKDYALWPVLAGGAFMLALLAAVVFAVITLTDGAEKSDTADAPAGYCVGFVNGVAYGIWEHGQVTGPEIAIENAAGIALNDPQAPQCDPALASDLPYDESFCEGFVAGYVTTGQELGWGPPPDGFDADFIQECLRVDVPGQPVIPGGGGPPPQDS